MKRLEVWTLDTCCNFRDLRTHLHVHGGPFLALILVHLVHLIAAIIKDASESVIFVSFVLALEL